MPLLGSWGWGSIAFYVAPSGGDKTNGTIRLAAWVSQLKSAEQKYGKLRGLHLPASQKENDRHWQWAWCVSTPNVCGLNSLKMEAWASVQAVSDLTCLVCWLGGRHLSDMETYFSMGRDEINYLSWGVWGWTFKKSLKWSTRLGTSSAGLGSRSRRRKCLLIMTDGGVWARAEAAILKMSLVLNFCSRRWCSNSGSDCEAKCGVVDDRKVQVPE